jgi:GAF domain-containing protein
VRAAAGSRTRLRSVVADILDTAWRAERGLHASASAVAAGECIWLGSTSEAASRCDGTDSEPSRTAREQSGTILVDDLLTETRWPEWRRCALEHGFRSVLVVPAHDGDVAATVTVLRERAGPWTPAEVAAATSQARAVAGAVLLAGAEATGDASATGAPSTQPEVERAVGIVMAQRRCSSPEALATLMEAAHRMQSPLPDACRRVAALVTGSLATP